MIKSVKKKKTKTKSGQRQVVVRLSDAEYIKLKLASVLEDLSMSELVRTVMMAAPVLRKHEVVNG